jgi:predicted acyltransferase
MTSEITGKPPRLLSLDIFRGFTMAAMILVNDPGDWAHIYPPLEHSVWNGCTPTDLIFPSFLFMAGVSIVYAMQSKKADTSGHTKLLLHAFRRMVTLIIISWLIQFFYHPSLSHLRFPGVLQRIAVVYFIATALYLKVSQKSLDWIFGCCLVGYYIIMVFIPTPDGHPANLDPETNFGAWLDRTVFTSNHLWASSKTWDPEGLLGVIPSVATGLFGMRVGTWLKRADRDSNTKAVWLFVYGILAIVAGMLWDLFFPINKALWTSSFVLYAGGISTVSLALAYWFIDVLGHKKMFWPFLVFGTNSISAYILADIVPGLINFLKFNHNGKEMKGMQYFYETLFAPHFSPVNASVVDALAFVLLIWLLMYPLYIKKIIIKV